MIDLWRKYEQEVRRYEIITANTTGYNFTTKYPYLSYFTTINYSG